MQQRLFWTINIQNPGKHEPFLLSWDLFKRNQHKDLSLENQALHALTSQMLVFLQKGKKDVYIFIFLSSFVLLEIKIFIICCFTFGISDRCDSSLWLPASEKRSAFPLPPQQQQRAVAREPAAAERLALIAVAAPRVRADDVITTEPTSSVTQGADGVAFGMLSTCRLTRSHLCSSRYRRRCPMVSEKHIFSMNTQFPSSDFIFRVKRSELAGCTLRSVSIEFILILMSFG